MVLATDDTMDRYAEPMQFEAGDELPEEYRKLLTTLFYHHAEVVTPSLFYERFIRDLVDMGMEMAPDADAKLRLANFYAEEIRHGYLFAKLYADLDPTLPDKILEASGLKRAGSADNPQASPFMEAIADWLDLALFNFLIDGEGCWQISEWETSSYAPLARIAGQVSRDERGHSNMGYLHLKRAVKDDPAAHGAAQERLFDKWYPMALDTFGRAESKRNAQYRQWSLKRRTNEELRLDFVAYVNPMLERLDFELPPYEHNRNFI